jgi:hypothetical protein
MQHSAEKHPMVRVKKSDGKYDYVRTDMLDYYISTGYLHPDSRAFREKKAHEHVERTR